MYALETVVPAFDFSTLDFSSLMTTFVQVLPVAIPVAIGFIGLRKALGYVMSLLKKA